MKIGLSVSQSVWIAAGLTAVLAVLHLAAPRLRRLPMVPEHYNGSFAGGLAVSYVFLHLLPEVAASNGAVGEALHDIMEPTPLVELGIFFVALVGFTVFYGLERLATGAREGAGAGGAPGVYWVHLGAFLVCNVMITCTMALRVRTGLLFALLFTVAMGLHFVLTDRGMQERFPAGSAPRAASCWPRPWSSGGWPAPWPPRPALCWWRCSPRCWPGRSC